MNRENDNYQLYNALKNIGVCVIQKASRKIIYINTMLKNVVGMDISNNSSNSASDMDDYNKDFKNINMKRTGIKEIHPDDRERMFIYFQKGIENCEIIPPINARVICVDGKYRWYKFSMTGEVGDSNVIVTLSDINEEVIEQHGVSYKADYDELTGIYNRSAFYHHTQRMLLENPNNEYVIIRMDIERFKVINDLFGVEEGDLLLKYIGNHIKDKIHGKGTYGRLGGDVFCACVKYQSGFTKIFIQDEISYLSQYKFACEIIPCFGVYKIDNPNIPVDIMCDRANLALQTIKGNYAKHYAYYDEKFRQNIMEEQMIIGQMSKALEQKQFVIYLQPKYNIETEKIVGAEALVRWIHPEKGFMSPNSFIPLFEKNGFIMKLDEYVWDLACQTIRNWLDRGIKPLPISVNISRMDLYIPELCDIICGLVEKYDIDPALLELELTESAYTENSQHLFEVMDKLQKKGFIFLMDDFGSGYSSLNLLKDINVDILKIDLRFLTKSRIEGKGETIVKSIIRMAKWLDIPVIAEGVETKEQAKFLLESGCTDAQGFYYAKPMTVNEYEIHLNKNLQKAFDVNTDRPIDSDIDIQAFLNPKSELGTLFDSVIGGVGIFKLTGDELVSIRVNDGFYDILDCERDEYISNSVKALDRVVLEDRVAIIQLLKNAETGNKVYEIQYRRILKNGKCKWIQSKIKFLSKEGNDTFFYASMWDISKMKELEQVAKDNSRKLTEIVDNVPGCIAIYEVSDKIATKYVNTGISKLTGYENDEYFKLFGDDLKPIILENDQMGIFEEIYSSLNEKRDFNGECRCRRKDGSVIWCNVRARLIENKNGILTFYALIFDITNQKQLEKDLFVQAERYSTIEQIIGVMTFDYDVSKDIIYFTLKDENKKMKKVQYDNFINENTNPPAMLGRME